MLVVKTLHWELHALQLEGEIGGKQKAQALLLIEERRQRATGSLERVLKGFAIALYCDLVKETLWLVADEEDAERLAKDEERRGAIYTGEEVRLVTAIKDPKVVRQVHEFKREFDTRMLPPDDASGH